MPARRLLLSLVALLLLAGCTSTVKVPVPPRVNLGPYQTIGLVSFSSNANDELEQLSTQKFLQKVQSAQPGTRVVELGSEAQVLSSVGRRSWDAGTLRAIKESHGVDAIVMGRLDVEKAKPDIQFSTIWKQLSVRADVDASLSARLMETTTGATMWTDSAKLRANVANASFNTRGQGQVGATDPDGAYSAMIENLACEITDDFRVHYVIRKVRKDELRTASAGGE